MTDNVTRRIERTIRAMDTVRRHTSCWWLDSGFLLKLHRDSATEFFRSMRASDDVDIAVGMGADTDYPALLAELQAMNSSCVEMKVGGYPVMIKLREEDSENGFLDLDIALYRLDHSGQSVFTVAPYRHRARQVGYFWQCSSLVTLAPYYAVSHGKNYRWPRNIAGFVGRAAFTYGYIEEPVDTTLTLTLRDFGLFKAQVPNDVEAYLEGRYGDWRMPRSTWDFTQNQRDLSPIPYPEMIRRFKAARSIANAKP